MHVFLIVCVYLSLWFRYKQLIISRDELTWNRSFINFLMYLSRWEQIYCATCVSTTQQHTDKLNSQVALHQLYQYASQYYDVVRKSILMCFISMSRFTPSLNNVAKFCCWNEKIWSKGFFILWYLNFPRRKRL